MPTSARHANVWEETAISAPPVPPLEGAHRAGVLVIGAGYLGLSAALHLALAGVDVVVVDTHAPGFGASGRNGGQVIPGLKYDPGELEAMFGGDRGTRLWRFAGETADVVFDLIERHGLACAARRVPWIQGVHSSAAVRRARQRVDDWTRRGAAVAFLDRDATAAIVGTDVYLGAFADHRAGSLQPLSYVRELARVAQQAGARLYTDARIATLTPTSSGWSATTATGARVEAETVILATNAYSDDLVPGLARSIVTLNSLQIATAPIPTELRRRMLPNGETVSDTRRVIRYWRLDPQGRLLLGGRGPYAESSAARHWAHLAHDVRRRFPALREIPFTHRWGGRVAVHLDHLPRLHQPQRGLLVAIGCQGRGVAWQTAMGVELARRVIDPKYEPALPFSAVRPVPFHSLKRAGIATTLLAYRALDRLGVA